jgi:hypothetical protein
VVGSVFALMETYQPVWEKVQSSEPVPMFGFPFDVGVEPITVNVERMIQAYEQGVTDLREIYEAILEPATLEAAASCARQPHDLFQIPDVLWVHMIYEFAAAWERRAIDREHMLQSLVPLYLGRTASFVLEVRESSGAEVEERIEQLCLVFEREKSYLTERWSSKAGKEQAHAKPG